MRQDSKDSVRKILDDALAVGRRLSAEARAGRPSDQPSGDAARLAGVDWFLDPVGGVVVQNLPALFTAGHCTECLVPLGERTRWRIKVRYGDTLSRQCDGVLAQLDERPAGPTYRLYTKRFLALLSPRERRAFRWRTVNVVNPTKSTPELFEIVSSDIHADVVALEGGNPHQSTCDLCGRRELPSYPLVGCLPDWLNPYGDHVRRGQPYTYLAAESLPHPLPNWFTFGDWRRGVCLAVSKSRWAELGERPVSGIQVWPLGRVTRDLVARHPGRAV